MAGRALDADVAAHGLDEVLDDREPESRAAHVARAAAVDAIEALEQTRLMARLDARARVDDLDARARPVALAVVDDARPDGDGRARGAIFHGVVDEVGQHLLEGAAIGVDR